MGGVINHLYGMQIIILKVKNWSLKNLFVEITCITNIENINILQHKEHGMKINPPHPLPAELVLCRTVWPPTFPGELHPLWPPPVELGTLRSIVLSQCLCMTKCIYRAVLQQICEISHTIVPILFSWVAMMKS